MKILYAINSAVLGGAEKHILELAGGMRERGHEVHIWCPQGPMNTQYRDAGATVVTTQAKFDLDPKYIAALYKHLKAHNIDVIHTHDLKVGCNGQLAAIFAKTPVRIGHIHTPISTWKIPVVKKIIDLVVYFFVANFLVSKEIAITEVGKTTKQKEGISKNKLVVIPNAVEPPRTVNVLKTKDFTQKWGFETNFIIGCIGRLTPEKDPFTLLKAFNKLSQEDENVRLALIGGGELEQPLKDTISELKLNDKVIITGVFEDTDKGELYKALSLFVFPSQAEGFGYVPLEALSYDLLVISSNLPVLKEVLGDSALYFNLGDPVSLYDELKLAINNYSNLQSETEARKKVLNAFTHEKFINAHEKLYKELLTR